MQYLLSLKIKLHHVVRDPINQKQL